ncbi:MAG: helix-turn-helix domain-containing protein [Fusobacteriaceae bacterium]|jgi:hypothetical protein|nr:helix-turn-helix domain-containing protein [Fusobacteriaceae bacterium]
MTEHPGYYAIIPAKVRYDKTLTFMERILYAEISALTNKNGFCHASNRYFADLYDVSVRTIISAIKKLVDHGYLFSQNIYKENSMEIEKRILSLDDPREKNFMGGSENNFMTPREKNFTDNNTRLEYYNNTHSEPETFHDVESIISEEKTDNPIPTEPVQKPTQTVMTETILAKYKKLDLPAYEYPPNPWQIMECVNRIGTVKLFQALEIMAKSDFVRRTMSVDSIFKVANLKKALNGNFRDPPPKEKRTSAAGDPDYSPEANTWESYEKQKGGQWKT